MFKKITGSFLLAFHNIRSHFFHTLLSVLGIVIGVAALVAILSLIDGMEKFAKEQITTTTSLNSIFINTNVNKDINGVQVRKQDPKFLSMTDFKELRASLTDPKPATMILKNNQTREVEVEGDTLKAATNVIALSNLDTTFHILHGRLLTTDEIEKADSNAMITQGLAKVLLPKGDIQKLIGKKINFAKRKATIVGILKPTYVTLVYPITLVAETEYNDIPPHCIIDAAEITEVKKIKEQVEEWLSKKYGKENDFRVMTNEYRVEQAARGFKLFRIIMGMIVGISVLVGGIGVMNVLLISVTERTAEIGVRKAVGANKRDIILQFLSESITISFFGSLSGLIIGILATMAFVPIIKALTGIPFYAAYTWNTLFVVSVMAIIVGIVFGTYPAIRAAKLDPVEAIRRE